MTVKIQITDPPGKRTEQEIAEYVQWICIKPEHDRTAGDERALGIFAEHRIVHAEVTHR